MWMRRNRTGSRKYTDIRFYNVSMRCDVWLDPLPSIWLMLFPDVHFFSHVKQSVGFINRGKSMRNDVEISESTRFRVVERLIKDDIISTTCYLEVWNSTGNLNRRVIFHKIRIRRGWTCLAVSIRISIDGWILERDWVAFTSDCLWRNIELFTSCWRNRGAVLNFLI